MKHPTFESNNYALQTYNRCIYMRNLKDNGTVVAERYFKSFSKEDQTSILIMAATIVKLGEEKVKKSVMSYMDRKAA